MNFHEMVAADIHDEFLDLDIFGEDHVVDGETIPCVLDTDVRSRNSDAAALGIYDADLVMFAAESDLPRGHEGDAMDIDGHHYIVMEWRVDMGVHRVTLKGTRGY